MPPPLATGLTKYNYLFTQSAKKEDTKSGNKVSFSKRISNNLKALLPIKAAPKNKSSKAEMKNSSVDLANENLDSKPLESVSFRKTSRRPLIVTEKIVDLSTLSKDEIFNLDMTDYTDKELLFASFTLAPYINNYTNEEIHKLPGRMLDFAVRQAYTMYGQGSLSLERPQE